MNETMPTISGVDATASVDFTSTNGALDFGSIPGLRIDTATEGYAINTLTKDEASALGTDFSVVFNAKLGAAYQANQPILYISSNGTANWQNALVLGTAGSANQLYYKGMTTGTDYLAKSGQIPLSGTTVANDDNWHTVAITANNGTISYYVDGVLVDSKTGYGLKSGIASLGSQFANSSDFAVQIGRYGTEKDGTTYMLKGDFNYWQFYSTALTADQVSTLAAASAPTDAEQMNAAMPSPVNSDVPEILASVDFTSSNGVFAGTDDNRVLLTDASAVENMLTLSEVKGMGKEYSIVFRARLDESANANQPILYISPDGADKSWNNAFFVGVPGKSDASYFRAYKGGADNYSSGGTYDMGGTKPSGDGAWHTIAIVQNETTFSFYVDGVLHASKATYLKKGIGEIYSDMTELNAWIGRYSKAEGSGSNYLLDGSLDFWQLYGEALTADQVAELSVGSSADGSVVASVSWLDTVKETNVWAVAGGQQLSGYQSTTANFSLFRLLNNGIRGGSSNKLAYRDIRMLNLASPNYTMASLVANYDTLIKEHESVYDVFMLIPELSEAEAADASLVSAYKANVETLIEKNSDKTLVLWTPLASGNDATNAIISQYAEAIRAIAAADSDILFFDVNKFMNEKMAANANLKTNWFEDGLNITPLCASDVVYAFLIHVNYPTFKTGDSTSNSDNRAKIKDHNLRWTSDKRIYKSGNIRDSIAATVTVSGTSITVDASAITTAYTGISDLRVAVVPAVGSGFYHEDIWTLGTFSGNTCTVEAPYSDPVITVYGNVDGKTYRFKDIKVDVETTNNQSKPAYNTDALTSLEVVGAPAIGFDPAKTTYDVELYQYQQQVRILAEGGDNLTIEVNGTQVEAGEFSQYIKVEDKAAVTVKVTGGTADKTYTLNLTRPDYPDIIITEVMTDGYANYTKSGADNYELIEIYNASGKDLNLLDYSIGYIRDYPYAPDNIGGEIPYYFTGNDHKFFGQTFLGINQITKYSSYWNDGSVTEPERVNFPADSTMVIWVKFSKDTGTNYGSSLTYETLRAALEAHKGTKTLTVDIEENNETVTKAIVPALDQLVVAEIPYGVAQSNVTQYLIDSGNNKASAENFYMDGFTKQNDPGDNRRGWLFVLDDKAEKDPYGALTKDGDDIISAAKYVRAGDTNKLSSVMTYNVARGMSEVKNYSYWAKDNSGAFLAGDYTSDQQGYSNKTSFGAIEYWQKPYDLADTLNPTAEDKTPAYVIKGSEVTIDLTLKDDSAAKDDAKGDVRYFELYVKKTGEIEYTKVAVKDFVLEAGVKNAGVSADQPSVAYTYELGKLETATSYYYMVTDGNGHTTESEKMTVNVVEANALNVDMNVTDARGNDVANVTANVTIELTKGENTAELAESYTVTLGGKDYTTVNGEVTIPMANEDSISIANLPAGTAYTVSVSAPDGYIVGEEVTGTIAADKASIVSQTAQMEKKNADLTVTMDIDKYYGDAAASSIEAQVKISVTTDSTANHDLTGTYTTSVDGVFLAKDGDAWTATAALSDAEKIVINGLPVGAKYTLTVTSAEGYANISTSNTGAVAESGTALTWNVKQNAPATGTLKVTMSVDDATTHNITINVQAGHTHDLTGTYAITGDVTGTLAKSGNAWTATLAMKNGQAASVTLPQGASYTVSLEDKANYTESVAATGIISAGESTATMQAAREEGSLEVSFEATDYKGNTNTANILGTITVQISDSTGCYDVMVGTTKAATIENGSANFSMANGSTAKVEGLLAGTTYTVTFTAPDGYTNTTAGMTTGTITKDNASKVALSAKENTPTEADLKLTFTADDSTVHGMTITVVTDKAGTYAVTNADGSQEVASFVQDAQDNNKYVATLTNLTNGWEGYIRDLPVGATYTVTPAPATGYEDNSTAAQLSGTVGTEDGAVVAIGKVAAGDLKVDMTIVDSENRAVSGVSAKVVIKLANVKTGHASIVTSKNFTYDSAEQTYSRELTLENGESETISGLPVGITYTVATIKLDGCEEPTLTSNTGTIAQNTQSAASVTHKMLAPAVGDLTVTLSSEDAAKQTVTITVTPAEGETLSSTYTVEVPSGVTVNQEGTASQWTVTMELVNGQSVTVKELPDGASYLVAIAEKSGYHVPAAKTGTILDKQTASQTMSVTNVKPGSLEVTLSAVDYKNNASDEEVSVEIVLSDIANNYNVVIGSMSVATSNGKATVTMRNGETAAVSGVPAGTNYSINVTTPAGYSNTTSAGTTSGAIAENTKATVSLSVKQNTPEQKNLAVTISIKGEDGTTADTTAEANIKIALTGELLTGDYELTVGSNTVKLNAANSYTAEVKLNDGETVTVADVPVGSGYTVNITAPEGYELKSDAEIKGTVDANTAAITSSVQKTKIPVGDLKFTVKVSDVDGKADNATEVTAKITLFVRTRAALSGSYDIVDADNEKVGTIEADSNGVYTGMVTVKNGTILYVKNVPAGVSYEVTLTVPNTHEDKSTVLSGTVQEGQSEIVLDVQEKQPEIKVGGLKIALNITDSEGVADTTTKTSITVTLTGDDLADSYEVKDPSGTKIGTITNSGSSYTGSVSLGNGSVAEISEIPVGTCFKVTVTVPDGFDANTETTVTGSIVENASALVTMSIQEEAQQGPGSGDEDPDDPSGGDTDPSEDPDDPTTKPTEDPDDPTTKPTEKPEEITKPTEAEKPADGSPGTGEEVRVVLWLWIALAAAAGAATILVKRRTAVND